jgi:hypothetical protein
MAAPTYTTDLTDITTSETVTGWSALGGGQSGLNDETDYFIQGTQCVSKNGFTASTRGQIFNAGATTIAAGDAVYAWFKQNNRNLMDTVANGGTQFLIGSGTGAFDRFYVDGNDSDGSALAGWRTYAVDPTATPSATTGSPSGTSYFGCQWAILGSGSLKGAPNGIDVIRHGREIQCVDGDLANGYATFDGAASFDADTTRAWGILTPTEGGYSFHGNFVMGLTGTAVDFRDSNRSITVLEDAFVASTFNEFEIRNASSNVEWTNITIQHLGTTSPSTLTLDVGTFTGEGCRFSGCGTTTFSSTGTCQNTTWENSGQITHAGATLNGSTVTGYTGAANTSAVLYNVAADPDGEMDDMTFVMGATATHAIEFGTSSPTDITLRNCVFNGYNATGTNNQNDSTFHVKRTSGTVTINLVGCSTDASDFSYRTDGATVVLVQDPVTTTIKVIDAVTKANLQNTRVLVEADTGGPLAVGTDIISGTTDVNGEISDTRTFASDQPIVGRARLSTTPGSLYQTGDIVGTISSVSGLTVTVQLIPDE